MYHDIADDITKSINEGLFDKKLPTEVQLMARYNVSRNTIRKAIDLVYQKGLLRRVQGSGYFVNDISLAEKTVINLSVGAGQPLHFADGKLISKVITFDKIYADAALARRMSIKNGSELYRVIRLRYLNNILYCLEQAYYVRSEVPFLSVDSVNQSIFSFLRENYGISANNSEDYISLEKLTPEDAALLELPAGTPALAMNQLNFYGNNIIFNCSTTIYVYPGLNFYFHSANLTSN
ncbi:GntR family transcriptional regulator [Loigolactobacillus jiayinensis]|uniref:GntR family transcriptional regulator n=1 Tax=Loigolactobacillus jiayinensis TaxID=2486016 RepID=A0ABW1RHV7_9LACO|nr:GntR family transcriptional regulator [Loigolactobacillus jiayinensis]